MLLLSVMPALLRGLNVYDYKSNFMKSKNAVLGKKESAAIEHDPDNPNSTFCLDLSKKNALCFCLFKNQ